jgi:hypothetical protein
MSLSTRLLPLLLGATLLVVGAQPSALAQDGRKKKPQEPAATADPEPPEKTAEQKELEAIGKDFKDKDVSALIARIEKDGKIRLALGQHDDTFTSEHAKTVLDDWLASRKISEVKLKESKDTTALSGMFTLKYRRRGKATTVVKDLEVRIKRDDSKFTLVALKVMSR